MSLKFLIFIGLAISVFATEASAQTTVPTCDKPIYANCTQITAQDVVTDLREGAPCIWPWSCGGASPLVNVIDAPAWFNAMGSNAVTFSFGPRQLSATKPNDYYVCFPGKTNDADSQCHYPCPLPGSFAADPAICPVSQDTSQQTWYRCPAPQDTGPALDCHCPGACVVNGQIVPCDVPAPADCSESFLPPYMCSYGF